MVVGEGPGADEDASGRPFVGRAGQLLDKMLAAIGLSRERNCFIANVVKCRPPGNRDPKPEEVAACRPFLHRQIAALSPGFLLAAGRVAAHNLLGSEEALGRLRGRFLPFTQDGGAAAIPLLVTYHPSALLRDESLKRPAFDDLKLLMSRLLAHDEGYRTEAAALAAKYGVSAREG
jgi:DNA polymerase